MLGIAHKLFPKRKDEYLIICLVFGLVFAISVVLLTTFPNNPTPQEHYLSEGELLFSRLLTILALISAAISLFHLGKLRLWQELDLNQTEE